jgi:hypothetical protein
MADVGKLRGQIVQVPLYYVKKLFLKEVYGFPNHSLTKRCCDLDFYPLISLSQLTF